MLGMAIRMATDLNLHRKSMVSGLDTEEGRARDLEVGRCHVTPRRHADGRSSTENEHGSYALSSIDLYLRKWVNHIRCAKTISSETPARLHGTCSVSRFPPTGLWLHMRYYSRSCHEPSIPSIPRPKLSLACVMIVTVCHP